MAVSLATESVVAVAVALALAFLTANQPADNKNMHNNCPETGMMMPIPNDDANRCRWVECSSSVPTRWQDCTQAIATDVWQLVCVVVDGFSDFMAGTCCPNVPVCVYAGK